MAIDLSMSVLIHVLFLGITRILKKYHVCGFSLKKSCFNSQIQYRTNQFIIWYTSKTIVSKKMQRFFPRVKKC